MLRREMMTNCAFLVRSWPRGCGRVGVGEGEAQGEVWVWVRERPRGRWVWVGVHGWAKAACQPGRGGVAGGDGLGCLDVRGQRASDGIFRQGNRGAP